MPTDIWMDRHWEAKVIVLSIEVVEVISPQILYVPWIDPAVRVGCLLDEHHGWEVICAVFGVSITLQRQDLES